MPSVSGVLLTAYADLQARVTALEAAKSTLVPVNFTVQLQMLAVMMLNINAMLALGIQPPSIQLQLDLMLALIVQLEAELAVILNLQNLLSTAGVHAYAYDGRADAFGGELSAQLSGGFPGGAPSDHTNALVLATTIPATWAAMAQVFKTT